MPPSTNRRLSKGQNGLAASLPLFISNSDGPYGLIREYQDLVKQNLKMLLLTNPGERIMNPDYGVGLMTFLFEQNVPENHFKLKARIQSQVAKYMPFIRVDDDIDGSEEEYQLNVRVPFFIIPLNKEEILEITIPTANS